MPAAALPPLVLVPIPVERPWGGGRAAALLGLEVQRPIGAAGATGASGTLGPIGAGTLGPIGEWWLLSARADHPSRVRGGPLDGASLVDLLAKDAERVVGARGAAAARRRFPLLLKILDTAEPLSVQVHPSDADLPGEGKTETWYVLAAGPDATFWLGLVPGRTAAELFELAARGESPHALLQEHSAKRGTIAHLEPGMLHALGADVLAVEFQTSADTTYRIWDWQRQPPRELHLDAARRVTRRDQRARLLSPAPVPGATPARDVLVACSAYRVERAQLSAPARFSGGSRFEVLLPLGAPVRVSSREGAADVPRSHAVLVPAATPEYEVAPQPANAEVELLRFVPGDAWETAA